MDPKMEDQSFPGTLSLVRDGRADVSLESFVPTATNVEKVGFLKPVISAWTAIYTKKPQFRCTYWSFVTVFTTDVWVSILATFLVFSVAYYVHLLYTPEYIPGGCLLIVLGTFTGKGLVKLPEHLSTRILLITILISGYLINNFFVFLLLGKLTYKTPSLPFETLEDMLYLQPAYSLNIHISSPILAGSRTATSGPLSTIGKLLSQHPGSVHADANTMVDKACQGNAAFLELTSKFFSYENFVNKCKLVRSKRLYFHHYLYIATRKDFPYSYALSQCCLRIHESGVFDRAGQVAIKNKAVYEDEVPIIQVIDMEMVLPIFFVYFILLIFSFLIFLIELYSNACLK